MRFCADDQKFSAEAFLFDKDGTLISFDHWFRVMEERALRLARAFGLDKEENLRLLEFMGVDRGSPGNWGLIPLPRPEAERKTGEFLAALLGVEPQGLLPKVVEIFAQVDRDFPFPQHLRPTPGAAELLLEIKKAGGKVAVVTHDIAQAARVHLEALGWGELVDEVVGLDVCPVKKPAPDPVLLACTRLGTRPQAAVMLGDTPEDLQAGRAARCQATIGVLTGLGTARELAPYADALLHNLQALRIG